MNEWKTYFKNATNNRKRNLSLRTDNELTITEKHNKHIIYLIYIYIYWKIIAWSSAQPEKYIILFKKQKPYHFFEKNSDILNSDEKNELLTKYKENLSIQPININIKVNLIAKTLNKGKITMPYGSQQIGTFHHDQMMWLSALFLYILF